MSSGPDPAHSLRRLDLWLMIGLVALAGAVMILWSHLGSELIPVRKGIGYDGTVYSAITRHPIATVFGDQLDVHRVQRIVPSLVVFVMLKPLGLNTSNPAIVIAFQILNYLMMALSAFLLWQITRRLQLSRAAGWIGFLALLFNYGLVKFQAYSPVMTDTAGFLLGMILVWCLVFKRPGLLPFVAVVGAFTWPTVGYSALGLYVLSRPAAPLRPSRWWGVATAALLAVALPAYSVHTYKCGTGCASTLMYNSVIPWLVPVSVLFLVAWLYLAFRPLLELATVPNVLRAVDWRRLLVAIILMILIVVVQRHLANPSFRTVSRTLYNIALGGIAKPGGFLVAHAVYFGPAVPLLVLTWRRAVRLLQGYGAGAVVLAMAFLLIATTNEARLLMNEWPFFVLLAAMVADRLGWRAREVGMFAALCLVASRVWFPVFHGKLSGDWRAYPDQFYGMSLGLKMTLMSYSLMGAGCVVCALVLLRSTRVTSEVSLLMKYKGRRIDSV